MTTTLRSRFPEVAFGTSGVRALVDALTPDAVSAYVYAFVMRMRNTGQLNAGSPVLVAMDLRPSSPAIAGVVCDTLRELDQTPVFAGRVPTPALALACLARAAPGIMVTGSHIPFDRNGIKFYGARGEIAKDDESAISSALLPPDCPVPSAPGLPPVDDTIAAEYQLRYITVLPADMFAGLRIGLYQHSAVGRDMLFDLLAKLGADVIALGRSDDFVPVDTEAVSEADLALARDWCCKHHLDLLISTDGDGDRPLVFDADGEFVRGDLLGLVCARELAVQTLAVPVSCNSAIEKSGDFQRVLRTRIGSPYVIEGMARLASAGSDSVAGFEANGGFLLGSEANGFSALPTRDAVLPILMLLARAVREKTAVAAIMAGLPRRYTYSDRIQNKPREDSLALLERLISAPPRILADLFPGKGDVCSIDTTDGVRMTFEDGDIVHLRPSGNAPELRCYAESDSLTRARELCLSTLEQVQ